MFVFGVYLPIVISKSKDLIISVQKNVDPEKD
jgi:hypothetical protein